MRKKRTKALSWCRRQIRRLKRVLAVLVLLSVGYLCSPLYWLSEPVYWEAYQQTAKEQSAIRWSIANRSTYGRRHGWEESFYGVVLDGEERGRGRDYTYRHDRTAWWIPEWAPILPIAHAYRNDAIDTWFFINLHTAGWLIGYYTGLSTDPTDGATFYQTNGNNSPWFRRKIAAGAMCNPTQIDAHTFYQHCRNNQQIRFP